MWNSFDDEDEPLPPGVERVPLSMLYRWYLYDTHPGINPAKYNKLFELSPVSDEGHAKEAEDSENRLSKVAPLESFLDFYSTITAEFVVELNKDTFLSASNVVNDAAKEHFINTLKESYRINAYYGLVSAFASAVELDLIKIQGTRTKVR